MYKDGLGLFKYGRFTQLIQGSANIIMSILLCNRYGAIGVYAATFITSALISWPLFTYYVFKIGLNQSVFKRIVEMAIRTAIIIGAIGLIKQSVFWIHLSGWCGFVGQVFVCVFVSNIIFILLFFRSPEFRGLLFRVKNIVQRAN